MPTDEALTELQKMGDECYDSDRICVAVELFALYLKHRPDDTMVRMRLGDSLRILGLKQEAEAEYLYVQQRRGDGVSWLLELNFGELYKDWAKYDLAEEHFRKCCDLETAPDWVWILRGANLAVAGRLDEAENCHRKATTLEKCDRDEAYLNLGYVLRANGNYVAAENAFKSALEITPDYKQALDGLKSVAGLEESLMRANKLLAE